VTGANTGLGKGTATQLLRSGCHVVMACRSKERGQAALDDLKQQIPEASIELMLVDLGDPDSIITFCKAFKESHQHLDVLVNNAGVVLQKRTMAKKYAAVEEMLSVNHLGTFLITHHLLDILEKSHGRVVTVASGAHSFCGKLKLEMLNLVVPEEDLGKEPGIVGTMSQYGFTKLCNILFMRQLNYELRNKSSTIMAFPVDPGWVDSELGNKDGKPWYVRSVETFMARSPEEGAYSSVYCACDPKLTVEQSGGYYDGVESFGSLKDYATSDEDAKILWDWTLSKVVGLL